MYDNAIHQTAMNTAVEKMDIWKAWDKDLIVHLNSINPTGSIEVSQKMLNSATIKGLGHEARRSNRVGMTSRSRPQSQPANLYNEGKDTLSPQIGREDIRSGDTDEKSNGEERGDQRETLFTQQREALSEKDSPLQANKVEESEEERGLPIQGEDED